MRGEGFGIDDAIEGAAQAPRGQRDKAPDAAVPDPPDAPQVKLADVADNADSNRLALLPEEQAQRLVAKYAAARRALTDNPDDLSR